jgi:hypothetical protein
MRAKRTLSHETSSLALSLMRKKGRMVRLRHLINGRLMSLEIDRFMTHLVQLFEAVVLVLCVTL